MPSNSAEVINVHRVDPTNIGDMAASPCDYFDWLEKVERVDIMDENFEEVEDRLSNAVVIYGGGGLLFDGEFTPGILGKNMRILHRSDPLALILWGAGHNSQNQGEYVHEKHIRIPDFLKLYDLVGLRDFQDSDAEHAGLVDAWVPCASCLHPEFDEQHEIEHEVVLYDHKDHRIPEEYKDPAVPALTNSGITAAEAIKFLATGETVVTTSYHGAYWGALLGRRVILSQPFSTKFEGFKYDFPVASDGNWKAVMNDAQAFPDALEEARAANLEFAEQVKTHIANVL